MVKLNLNQISLVLDMDETLIHCFEDISNFKNDNEISKLIMKQILYKLTVQDIMTEKGKGVVSELLYVKRNGLDNFLKWTMKNLKNVIIWSAGNHTYVYNVVEEFFGHAGLTSPDLIFTREDVVYDKDGNPTKPLQKIFDIEKFSSQGLNHKNTLIIDDLLNNLLPNEKNGILINRYQPDYSIDTIMDRSDNSFEKLIKWFESIDGKYEDVRTINKKNIFN